jgi:kynurenine formamidase
VITRGVLLDVAAAKGVHWIEPGKGVFPEDLEAAEARQGVRVESGDAVLLRTGFGRFRRETVSNPPSQLGAVHPGWHAATLPWLRERDVAIIGCDSATDVMPSGYGNVVLPVHTVGIVAMGLWIIDNCDLEEVAVVAASSGRWEFQLSICPLALSGLTSSPVNPVATF